MAAEKVIVIDTSKCTACRGCQTACKMWNDLPAVPTKVGTRGFENPPDVGFGTYTRITWNEYEKQGGIKWLFGQQRCMHCGDAGCMKACPVPGAITRTESGAVVIDQKKCTGCKYCLFACPFSIPRYDRGNVRGFGTDKSYKCTLCFDRTGNGLAPACVKTCPTGALSYVDKDAVAGLSDAAKKKGLTVYGGKDNSLDTHVVFFLDGTPKEYGLPDKPAIPTSTFLWRTVMRPIGIVAFLAAVAAAAVHYMAIGPKDSGEGGEH